jgi:cysteine desulfurase
MVDCSSHSKEFPPVRFVYLDHNSTTPLHPQVLEAFISCSHDRFGNPSSIHWAGRESRAALESAREQVARFCGCEPSEVIFTSGGTEADNLAIKGVAAASIRRGRHIVTTAVEHPAVLASCLSLEQNGYDITRLTVDRFGRIDMAQLEAAITPETILISAMFANNETGVIFPVAAIGGIAARHRIPFHCDAVQAAGWLPLDCRALGIGLLALSGHKLQAPRGVGALIARTGVRLHPILHGGAQERNRRAGTENLPAIFAFGVACALAAASLTEASDRVRLLRDRLEAGVLALCPGAVINGDLAERLPNTVNISFPGARVDSLLASLDLQGVAASSGAACSSGTVRHSPVLAAMGISPETAGGSVRFSLGRETTEEDIGYLLEILPGILERLRSGGGAEVS